jgi:hypothetical protein
MMRGSLPVRMGSLFCDGRGGKGRGKILTKITLISNSKRDNES